MSRSEGFREPVVAGYFYPADREVLARRIETFTRGEPVLPEPGPRGLICPHAGYDYSGPTAGVAYREIRGRRFDAILVLAPSHYDRFHGATIWPGAGYRTPLGEVSAPADIVEALSQLAVGIQPDLRGHREEHAAEVQIPFLQVVAPGAPVLPIVLADDRRETCERIGEAIAAATADRTVLLVASSDLYHGHSGKDCRETDARTLGAIERNDPDDLAEGFASDRYQACGRGPIQVLLHACRRAGAEKVRILSRTNSDEVVGRPGSYVVGYAAVTVAAS
ncbi:MAG: AmmeMemoRadiSam system protein B [Candidatus Eisenbacteria bacterium]